MKRYILSLLTVVLCAVIAFAQNERGNIPYSATFVCPDGIIKGEWEGDVWLEYMEIDKVNTTVKIYLDTTPWEYCQPTIMITTGTVGCTVDSFIEYPEIGGRPIVVDLNATKWGVPVDNAYHALIMLTFVGQEGEFLKDRDGEPVIFQMPCVLPVDSIPAGFVYAYPDGTWYYYYQFADAYEEGNVEFVFSSSVRFEDDSNIGTIAYHTTDGNVMYMNISDYTLNTDTDIQGSFEIVNVNIRSRYLTADDIDKIVITLSGIKSLGGQTISVPEIVLENKWPYFAPRKKQSRMAENLIESDAPITIYSIQGMAVKENVDKSALNDLPAGLYIIDGKKVIVK